MDVVAEGMSNLTIYSNLLQAGQLIIEKVRGLCARCDGIRCLSTDIGYAFRHSFSLFIFSECLRNFT